MNKITRRNVLLGLAATPLITVVKPIGVTGLPQIYDEHEAYRYITSKFREGPSTLGPYAVTNESYIELGLNERLIKAKTKTLAWDKFWYAFDDYASDKSPSSFVFFRIKPEHSMGVYDDKEWHRMYCRLLISSSKWDLENANWNNEFGSNGVWRERKV